MLGKFNLKSDFLKSVVLLTSGTVIAQAISLLASPIILRMFNAEEMGELGFFLRIITFISSIATARYDMAIPLPKRDNHAFQLFRLSLSISKAVLLASLLGGLIYWAIGGFESRIALYIVAILVGTYGLIFRSLGSNWAIRSKAFRRISLSKVFGAIGMNGFKIAAGLLGTSVVGLFVSTILGIFVSVGLFMLDFLKIKQYSENKKNKLKQYALAKEHSTFPKVNLPHVLVDNGRDLLIAIFFIEFFSESVFGSYDLSFRTLGIPLALVGSSIGQIFFQRCTEMYNSKLPVFPLLKKTTLLLAALSIVPFGIIFLFGEELFAFVFSEEWRFAGKIAEILSPWLMVNFVSSPISSIPLVIRKQALFFWLGMGSSALQILGFGLLPALMPNTDDDVILIFKIVSFSMALYLFFIIIIKLKLSASSDRRLSVH